MITVLLTLFSLILLLIYSKEQRVWLYQSSFVSWIVFLKIISFDIMDAQMMSMGISTRVFVLVVAIFGYYLSAAYMSMVNENHTLRYLKSWAGSILAFLLIAVELTGFWISLGWGVWALALIVFGFVRKNKQLRLQGLIIFVISICKVFIYDTQGMEPVYRTASFIVLGLLLLGVSFLYSKHKSKFF
jgi:uncharacterized membrane protein